MQNATTYHNPSLSPTTACIGQAHMHTFLSQLFPLCGYGLGHMMGPLVSTEKSTFCFYLEKQLLCCALKSVGCLSLDVFLSEKVR